MSDGAASHGRNSRHCERREAIQTFIPDFPDCFVAARLAVSTRLQAVVLRRTIVLSSRWEQNFSAAFFEAKTAMNDLSGSRKFTALSLVLLVAYFFVLAMTFKIAFSAYGTTPDIENFGRFAEPESTRFDGKVAYLFGPLFMDIAVFIWAVIAVSRSKVPVKRAASGLFLMAILLFLATAMQTERAERATHERLGERSVGDASGEIRVKAPAPASP